MHKLKTAGFTPIKSEPDKIGSGFTLMSRFAPLRVKLGFTLIELMVAITLMGIIASIGMVSYSSAQISARDAKRKNDLHSIQTALELYRQKNGHYPCTTGWQTTSSAATYWIQDSCASPVASLDSNYINFLPKDPQKNNGNPIAGSSKGYAYFSDTLSGGNCPTPSKGNYYVLIAGLENANDLASNKNKSYKYCNGSDISTNQNVFAITSQ